jgi:hypothetical protein
MTRKRFIRKKRGKAWDSESSELANAARWAREKERRDAETPARLLELAIIDAENLPRKEGDAFGVLQWTNLSTGHVRRWVFRIGDRRDRVCVCSSDGRSSASHGLTFIFNSIRSKILKS